MSRKYAMFLKPVLVKYAPIAVILAQYNREWLARNYCLIYRNCIDVGEGLHHFCSPEFPVKIFHPESYAWPGLNTVEYSNLEEFNHRQNPNSL